MYANRFAHVAALLIEYPEDPQYGRSTISISLGAI